MKKLEKVLIGAAFGFVALAYLGVGYGIIVYGAGIALRYFWVPPMCMGAASAIVAMAMVFIRLVCK